MNKTQRKKLKLKLQAEINTTKEIIIEYTSLCKPIAPENSIGRVSRMDAINNKSIVEAALREAKNKLHDLNLIISRANKDDFGRCIRCKTLIIFERLIIRPESRFCMKCAQ